MNNQELADYIVKSIVKKLILIIIKENLTQGVDSKNNLCYNVGKAKKITGNVIFIRNKKTGKVFPLSADKFDPKRWGDKPQPKQVSQQEPTLEGTIAEKEAQISRNDFETAIIFDKDGNEIARVIGQHSEVSLSGYSNILNGAIVTHNHPFDTQAEKDGFKNISAFSTDDVLVAFKNNISELRMVVGDDIHSFSWNKDTSAVTASNFALNLDKQTAIANKTMSSALKKADKLVYQGKITTENEYMSFVRSINEEAIEKINSFIMKNQNNYGYSYKRGNKS